MQVYKLKNIIAITNGHQSPITTHQIAIRLCTNQTLMQEIDFIIWYYICTILLLNSISYTMTNHCQSVHATIIQPLSKHQIILQKKVTFGFTVMVFTTKMVYPLRFFFENLYQFEEFHIMNHSNFVDIFRIRLTRMLKEFLASNETNIQMIYRVKFFKLV